MTADSQAPSADQWARLIARSFAFEWCGLDAAAGPLRTACAELVYGVLSQAAAASGGQTLVRLMTALRTGLAGAAASGPASAFLPGQVSPEEATAQAFARVLCGFLPGELRSVSALLASAMGAPKRKKPRPPGAAAVSGRWPSVPDLGKQLEKLLEELGATVCPAAAKDIATWFARVPYQVASGVPVAAAIVAAFKALAKTPVGTSGLISSNAELGDVVHDNLAAQVGREFAVSYRDRILVAENDVYLPGSVAPISLDEASQRLRRAKDYSLTVLAQARGAVGPLYIRAKGATTSREDLAVFKFGPPAEPSPRCPSTGVRRSTRSRRSAACFRRFPRSPRTRGTTWWPVRRCSAACCPASQAPRSAIASCSRLCPGSSRSTCRCCPCTRSRTWPRWAIPPRRPRSPAWSPRS